MGIIKKATSVFKKSSTTNIVKNNNNLKPCIELPVGVYIIDEQGYIEGGGNKVKENTKNFLNILFTTYGSVIIISNRLIYIAIPLKCLEQRTNRSSDRVGIYVANLNNKYKFKNWINEARHQIKQEVDNTTNGLKKFYESAEVINDFSNGVVNNTANISNDIGYTLINVIFKNIGIKTGINGFFVVDMLMRKKSPLTFYVCNENENIEKWNFDVIISKNAEKKEIKEYSNVYKINKNLRLYRSTLEKVYSETKPLYLDKNLKWYVEIDKNLKLYKTIVKKLNWDCQFFSEIFEKPKTNEAFQKKKYNMEGDIELTKFKKYLENKSINNMDNQQFIGLTSDFIKNTLNKNILKTCINAGIVNKLKTPNQNNFNKDSLVSKLKNEHSLKSENAQFAIDAWVYILGLNKYIHIPININKLIPSSHSLIYRIKTILETIDFYPQEYVNFLICNKEIMKLIELFEQKKISKGQIIQFSKEHNVSIESKNFFKDDFLIVNVINKKKLKELNEKGWIELLVKLLNSNLLDEKICTHIINRIESKDDLELLYKQKEIWNKREKEIKKKWHQIFNEVEKRMNNNAKLI